MSGELEKKMLKGSGGHIVANLTREEVKKGMVAGVDLFIGAVGRIEDKRVLRYFCKNCNKEFDGAPEIKHEKVNEEVAKGHTLSEQGQYICKQCGKVIAEYKTFTEHGENSPRSFQSQASYEQQGFVALRKLIGVNVYDENAILVGTIKDIGLSDNKSKIVVVISTTEQTEREIPWDTIMKIGDVVLIKPKEQGRSDISFRNCKRCGFDNKVDSKFCEECGNKLS
ncbi:MAG: PRC-barrel domain-containing protein [Nitrososphaerales archaeon]